MGRKYGDFFNHNLNAVICTPNIKAEIINKEPYC